MIAVMMAHAASVSQCSLRVVDAMHKVGTVGAGPASLTRPVAAARGELVHVQAVLKDATSRAAQIDATVPGLGNVTVRAVAYHDLPVTFRTASPPGKYPDALVPAADGRTFDLGGDVACAQAGTPCVFWISLQVPRDAAPGAYRGTVSARTTEPSANSASAAASCLAKFSVSVSKFTLPTAASELTGAQFEQGGIIPFDPHGSFSPETALKWFASLAAQNVNQQVWFELDSMPWSPTYRFNADRTAVTLNTSAHEHWWPKVLELTGSKHWHLPFSSRISRGQGALPHLVPDNISWSFTDERGKSFTLPVFAPPFHGTLNAEFERCFRLLFGATVDYLEAHGWADDGAWVQVADEPTWTDNATLTNILSLMRLYRSVSPKIRLYQTRFPMGAGGGGAAAADGTPPVPLAPPPQPQPLPPAVRPLLDLVDWWCAHVCQWTAPGVPEAIGALRASRRKAGRAFFATVYDNGVPIIEAPWERLRSQALDVFSSNGTLDGTLSWYSINSYGVHRDPATNKTSTDPWLNPMPSRKPGATAYADPAGWGYLVWPPPPRARSSNPSAWGPLDSARWVHMGAGIQDAEYLYALREHGGGSAAAAALLRQARRMATHFPSGWNKGCAGSDAHHASWDDDGFSVDPANRTDGSSVVNEWKLAMAAVLDELI